MYYTVCILYEKRMKKQRLKVLLLEVQVFGSHCCNQAPAHDPADPPMPPVHDFETRHLCDPRSSALLDRSWEVVLKFLGSPTPPVRPVRRPLWRRNLPSGATTIIAFSLHTRSPSPRSRAVRAAAISHCCFVIDLPLFL